MITATVTPITDSIKRIPPKKKGFASGLLIPQMIKITELVIHEIT